MSFFKSQSANETGTSSSLSLPTLALGLLTIYIGIQLVQVWQRSGVSSALENVPIADRDSWLFGNAGDRVNNDDEGTSFINTARKLNSNVYLWPMQTGKYCLVAGDNIMINYILGDIKKFVSPVFRLEFIKFLVGGGIILAGPTDHARHRRIMGPAFTSTSIRSLAPVFTAKADDLGNKLLELARTGGHSAWNEQKDKSEPQKSIVNISEIVDAASFDIIGKAGFGEELECVKKGINNVGFSSGYNKMLQHSVKFNFSRILLFIFAGIFNPAWMSLPLNDANRVIHEQNRRIEKLTEKIVDEKVAKAKASLDSEVGELSSSDGLDLVDMIIRSNLQMERKGSATLSRDDLRGSIQTLMFAGYETSAVATSMCLYHLAQNPTTQKRVRAEIQKHLDVANEGVVRTDPAYRTQLTADELQSEDWHLTINCIKETLRTSPAVTMTNRVATEDCVLPLARPIPRRDGKGTISQIAIPKGTEVGVNLKLASADPDNWGPDADKWNPDRWDNLPASYKNASMPGPAGVPAFSNGPSSCLGSRFAMLEIQALLVGVLQRVSFAPSPHHKIATKQVIVVRPTVIDKGVAALPLIVEPV